jgi:predicted RND superfamily exporter protein
MAEKSKRLWAAVVMPVVIGLVGFFSLTQRPRFQAFHTVDVLQLLGTGMCFGIALAALLGALRGRR